MQQFRDDGQHSFEMRRPARTFELAAERTRKDGRPRTRWIHVGSRGREDKLDSLRTQQFHVRVERPRVRIQVFTGTELQRVDEDRHDDHRTRPLCLAHEMDVSGMQRPHGRHQGHRLPYGPKSFRHRVHHHRVVVDGRFTRLEATCQRHRSPFRKSRSSAEAPTRCADRRDNAR